MENRQLERAVAPSDDISPDWGELCGRPVFCNPPPGLPEWSTLTGGGVSGAKRLVERGWRV